MIPKASELVAEWRELEAQGELSIEYYADQDTYVVVDDDGHVAMFMDRDDGLNVVISDLPDDGPMALSPVGGFVLERFGQ